MASDFRCRQGSPGFSVPDTFINGGESFLVFIVSNGTGIFQVELLWLRHTVRVA
jgi:hypothetical protein